MVLGQMQLTVLRKLKKEGPLSSGLHPSVNSLERAGFVGKAYGVYSLSESGQLALIAHDEMTEFHRQILMQMNRASINDEMYNADAFKTKAEKDAFDDLLGWGLVDVDNDGDITLLENGRILWGVWTQAHALRDETKGGFDAANEKQREKKRLKTEPRTWVEKQQEKDTHVGQWMTIERPTEAQEISAVTPPITEIADCPDCANCIDAEVLDMIAAKYPKVKELRETLLQQKRLMNELGL